MKQNASCGIGLVLLLGAAMIPANAQNQAPANSQSSSAGTSLGDYARQVRKEPDAAKSKAKVFDNDNLPREDKLSVVGTPSEPKLAEAKPEEQAAATTEPKAATTEKSADTGAKPLDEAARQNAFKQWADKIEAQQQQIDQIQRELDLLQREYQVRAAAMYGDVGNRLRNSAEWDKQDAQYKQQIADKQKAADDAKQKLDDLREEARKAGVPSSVREP
jgi:hypothetical protein